MIYFIPTPIWNLEDITLRALRLFKELDIFFCEDTRTTKKLFSHYQIDYSDKTFYSYTSFSSYKNEKLLDILSKDVGLVSEAWTPWLSDPGKNMIKFAWENNIKFSILPWANALIPAVVWAYADTSNFFYCWFLPQKKGRQSLLKNYINLDYPTFFYESVHRVDKLLTQLLELKFDWKVFIAREISKVFEEFMVDNVDNIIENIESKKLILKWEFVIWILPKNKNDLDRWK